MKVYKDKGAAHSILWLLQLDLECSSTGAHRAVALDS